MQNRKGGGGGFNYVKNYLYSRGCWKNVQDVHYHSAGAPYMKVAVVWWSRTGGVFSTVCRYDAATKNSSAHAPSSVVIHLSHGMPAQKCTHHLVWLRSARICSVFGINFSKLFAHYSIISNFFVSFCTYAVHFYFFSLLPKIRKSGFSVIHCKFTFTIIFSLCFLTFRFLSLVPYVK